MVIDWNPPPDTLWTNCSIVATYSCYRSACTTLAKTSWSIRSSKSVASKTRPVLERIGAQHGLLKEPMDEARTAIAAWRASPSIEGGQTVVTLITTVDETLRPHFEEEETELLPVASAWMSPEEWAQLPGHALRSFSGDKPWLALGLVRERLTSDQRDQMLSGMPPELQSLWTDQWEPAFTSFMAEIRQ